MKLREWLDSEGLSQNKFSKEMDVDRCQLSRWIMGHHVPDHKWLKILYQRTDGAVTPNDFYLSKFQ